jgi:hypothetical protein
MPPVPNLATSVFAAENPVGETERIPPLVVQALPVQFVWALTSWPLCVFVVVVPFTVAV